MKQILTQNYTPANTKENLYIIIHYTGNPNTSADQNARYFQTTHNQVSAHYVVDEKEIINCVPDQFIAWHIGGKPEDPNYHPFYKKAMNSNSLGIELCCKGDLKNISYDPETIKNAIKLTVYLMIKYHIPISRVITHHDVTGKMCPRNFNLDYFKTEVKRMFEDLEKFEMIIEKVNMLSDDIKHLKNQLERLNKKEIKYWNELTDEEYIIIRNLYDKGIIKGRAPDNLGLTEDMVRLIVYNARAGLYNNL